MRPTRPGGSCGRDAGEELLAVGAAEADREGGARAAGGGRRRRALGGAEGQRRRAGGARAVAVDRVARPRGRDRAAHRGQRAREARRAAFRRVGEDRPRARREVQLQVGERDRRRFREGDGQPSGRRVGRDVADEPHRQPVGGVLGVDEQPVLLAGPRFAGERLADVERARQRARQQRRRDFNRADSRRRGTGDGVLAAGRELEVGARFAGRSRRPGSASGPRGAGRRPMRDRSSPRGGGGPR